MARIRPAALKELRKERGLTEREASNGLRQSDEASRQFFRRLEHADAESIELTDEQAETLAANLSTTVDALSRGRVWVLQTTTSVLNLGCFVFGFSEAEQACERQAELGLAGMKVDHVIVAAWPEDTLRDRLAEQGAPDAFYRDPSEGLWRTAAALEKLMLASIVAYAGGIDIDAITSAPDLHDFAGQVGLQVDLFNLAVSQAAHTSFLQREYGASSGAAQAAGVRLAIVNELLRVLIGRLVGPTLNAFRAARTAA